MAKLDANADNRLADLLLELKRHLKSCRGCQGAMKTRDRTLLCDHSIGLILTAAWQYDHVIPRRIKAKRGSDPHVFACPDPSAHGKANSLTAEPLIVCGIETTLF
jgi:hypothetical protein